MRILLTAAASIGLASCGNAGQSESDALGSRLAPGKGEVVWRVSEKRPGGTENRHCFTIPHRGAVVYWPSRRTLSFTLSQGGYRKTLTSTFDSKSEHEVIFYWDQIAENIGLSVDGKPARERAAVPDTPWELSCPF